MTGIVELEAQTERGVRNEPLPSPSKFAHPILGNCLPQIDDFLPNGYTKEEMKMVHETRKIMGDDVDRGRARPASACRSPYSHSESILVETERPITAEEAARSGRRPPGSPSSTTRRTSQYPLAADAVGRDDVFVGRIRRDLNSPNALLFWCVSDNLRKGAATNAVQIAEELLKLEPARAS